jgi:hypothetical protein
VHVLQLPELPEVYNFLYKCVHYNCQKTISVAYILQLPEEKRISVCITIAKSV